VCNASACATSCGLGQNKCGTQCVVFATDDQNCGACGNVCPTGQNCTLGTCH
jgi:Stigma-specific protein, Stig1